MAGIKEVQANWMSLKYTFKEHRIKETPKVKQANKNKMGRNNKVSQPISKPKINIKILNGIKDKNKLINDATCAAKGNAMVGTLIDFKTPELLITDSMTWMLEDEKKVQNIKPVKAYSGYLSIPGKA